VNFRDSGGRILTEYGPHTTSVYASESAQNNRQKM